MSLQQASMTTDNSAIIANQIAASGEEPKPSSNMINTRFGKIKVNRDAPIQFTKGLLGMPDKNEFCLVDFPVGKFEQFKLLQSLEDDNLSFITLPIDLDNPIIERADIEEGCRDLGIPTDELALLLIVSVHRDVNQVRLSANARAPLFMHANKRYAEQYVLRNNKYVVRHMISG
jgi:flagellar assembly factor FliW